MVRKRLETYPVRTFKDFISLAPEWMRLEILAYYFQVPGGSAIRIEWNGRQGRSVSATRLMSATIAPFPCSLDGIGHTAKELFYKNNTFCLARTRLARQPYDQPTSFWLPPQDARRWIRHLKIEIHVTPLRSIPHLPVDACKCPLASKYECRHSDWPFLKRLASGIYGFTGLETLDLVFLGKTMTAAELEAFYQELKSRNPLKFSEASKVRVSYQIDPRVEDRQCAAARRPDEKVTAVLLRHMSVGIPPNYSPPNGPQSQYPTLDEQVESRTVRICRRATTLMARFRIVRHGNPLPEPLPKEDSGTSDSSS